MSGAVTDPYEAFALWCLASGFEDVIECAPEAVDLDRMHEAIDQYGKS